MRAIVLVGLPLVFATLFQATFNLTEVWIFGQIGDGGASLAGAGASDLITAVFALLANGLGQAAVAEISRAHGAGDVHGEQRHARQALVLGAILSLGSAVVGLLADPVGSLVIADGEARVQGTAFLNVMALGFVGTIYMAFGIAILKARGDTVRALVVVAIASVATLALEAVFILGLFGVEPHSIVAAGWITVILRGLAALALVWMIARRISLKPPPGERFVHLATLRHQLSLGLTAAVQQSLRLVALIVVLAIITAHFTSEDGTNSVFTAANIWIKLDLVVLMMAFAWGGGVAPVVGMSLGARRPRYARRAAWSGVVAVGITSLITTVGVLVFGPALVAVFVPDDPAAVVHAEAFFRFVAPFYAFVGTGIVIANAFNGAGDMRTPLIWDVLIMAVLQSALCFVLADPEVMGVAGIGLALVISSVLQGVVPGLLLSRARWR